MNLTGLLTSAGINIGLCVLFFSLYSILRKQPGLVGVFFARRVAKQQLRQLEHRIERFVPSASWIKKAWETTEQELLSSAGLDAVVFIKIVLFSIQIFSIAAVACLILVLPCNYYGKQINHARIPSEELEVFTIVNVQEGSRQLWTHVAALYVITCSACTLLYFNYKSITHLRLAHISQVPANLSYFTVLVRSIPWSSRESYSDSVKKFFTKYYASSYLSHQMVHRSGKIHKLMTDAEKVYKMLISTSNDSQGKPSFVRCGLCGEMTSSFKILSSEDGVKANSEVRNLELTRNQKEHPAALVFFKTRHGAFTASQGLQSSNPMLWVIDLAPDPCDVYWSNLCIPYRQLWIRRIATLIAAIAFMLLFLAPVTVVQALTDATRLAKTFPFLKKILKWKFMTQVVEGYLPSVILMLFLYTAPPLMMLFSSVEGSISRIGRKRSACCKVLYFTIWNVFFVNIFSGTVIKQLDSLSYLKNIPIRLGQAVPSQAILFMTYIMTSGWASLSVELLQPFMLLAHLFSRYILKKDTPPDGTLSFPYHTEVPRVLLFGFIGLTCSVLAPLITPFLLAYFALAYLVYRNQFLNVYIQKYESGGQFWPIAHNSTIFSLVLAQIIAIGVFGLKKSPVASGFTIPLVICTLLFNEYCRHRFSPVFKYNPAEVLMDMDLQDERNGRMEEIHQQLPVAYCQFTVTSQDFCRSGHSVLYDVKKSEGDPEINNSACDCQSRPKQSSSGITLAVAHFKWVKSYSSESIKGTRHLSSLVRPCTYDGASQCRTQKLPLEHCECEL
ncbi:unnamed protein product [Rhodiola kirilowii]